MMDRGPRAVDPAVAQQLGPCHEQGPVAERAPVQMKALVVEIDHVEVGGAIQQVSVQDGRAIPLVRSQVGWAQEGAFATELFQGGGQAHQNADGAPLESGSFMMGLGLPKLHDGGGPIKPRRPPGLL